jgi:hypothetical protein
MVQLLQQLFLVAGLLVGLLALLLASGYVIASYKVWKEPRDYESMAPTFRRLLRSGLNGGFIVITHARSKLWIQLSKYIRATGDYGIELSFPEVEWTRPYFARVQALVEAHRLPSRIVIASDGTRFLDIDFAADLETALATGRAIFRDVFGASLTDRFHSEEARIDALDRLVDDPDQQPLSCMEAYRHFREAQGRRADAPDWCWYLAALGLLLAGSIGAVVSVASVTESSLSLTVDLATIRIRAPLFDLVCLSAYATGRAIRSRYKTAGDDRKARDVADGWLSRIVGSALRLLVFTSIGIVIARWFSW